MNFLHDISIALLSQNAVKCLIYEVDLKGVMFNTTIIIISLNYFTWPKTRAYHGLIMSAAYDTQRDSIRNGAHPALPITSQIDRTPLPSMHDLAY